MILLVTHGGDLGADLVIRHLRDRQASYYRLDTDRLGSPDCHFGFSDDRPQLVAPDTMLAAGEVRAVWHRRLARAAGLDQVSACFRDFAARELACVLDAFLDSIPGLQVNAFEVDRLAGNRLLQAQRARAVGFTVPATLVTQDAALARDFVARHGAVVTKALSFGLLDQESRAAAYTSPVEAASDWTGLRVAPCLLQARVPKRHEWRVTTVAGQVFAARTRSGAAVDPDDWRLSPDAAEIFEPASLPPAVQQKLLRLCEMAGLHFATHDLIETPAGEFCFLETNPAGQWGWLELSLGLPIGAALAGLLARGQPGGA